MSIARIRKDDIVIVNHGNDAGRTGKVIIRRKKYHVHDEADTAKVGDDVVIMETRPLSATKRWRIVKEEK